MSDRSIVDSLGLLQESIQELNLHFSGTFTDKAKEVVSPRTAYPPSLWQRMKDTVFTNQEKIETGRDDILTFQDKFFEFMLSEFLISHEYTIEFDNIKRPLNILDSNGSTVHSFQTPDKKRARSKVEMARELFWPAQTQQAADPKMIYGQILFESLDTFLTYQQHTPGKAKAALRSALEILPKVMTAYSESPTPSLSQAETLTQEPLVEIVEEEVAEPDEEQVFTGTMELTLPRREEPAQPVAALSAEPPHQPEVAVARPSLKIKPKIKESEKKNLLAGSAQNLIAALEEKRDVKESLAVLTKNVDTIILGFLNGFQRILVDRKLADTPESPYSLDEGQWRNREGNPVSQREIVETAFVLEDKNGAPHKDTTYLLKLIEACEQVKKGNTDAAKTTLRVTRDMLREDLLGTSELFKEEEETFGSMEDMLQPLASAMPAAHPEAEEDIPGPGQAYKISSGVYTIDDGHEDDKHEDPRAKKLPQEGGYANGSEDVTDGREENDKDGYVVEIVDSSTAAALSPYGTKPSKQEFK